MEHVEQLEAVRKSLFKKYGVQFSEQTAKRWIADQMKAEARLRRRMEQCSEESTSSYKENVPQRTVTPLSNGSCARLEDTEEHVSGSEDSFQTVVFTDDEALCGSNESRNHQNSPEEGDSSDSESEEVDEEESDEDDPIFEPCHALLLRNRGTDCFVNSAVNILSAIDDIRQWAEAKYDVPWNNNNENEQESLLSIELCRVLAGRCFTVARIRRQFENEDLRFGQNDANEALHELMKSVPTEAKSSIVIERIAKWNCDNCGDSEIVTEKLEDIYRAVYQVSGFFQILPEEQQERTCLRCDRHKEKEILKYAVPDSTTHIIVRLSKGEPDNFVTDIPKMFAQFGAQWKLLCASHYLPNRWQPYGRGGHYVTWWKFGNEWKCISDDEVHTFEDVSFDELDIGILVYKRM